MAKSSTKKKTSAKTPRKGRETLYLVDASALIYRAYFAFIRNPLVNSRGENTSAPFGFTSSLLKILREEKPDYMAIVYDTKEPTFRHKRYEEYKSTRAKMPDELVEQLPRVYEIVEALNIPSFKLEGYEADDLIGTLAKKGEEAGLDVWVVSGDKDFCQLVDGHIKIYNSKKQSEKPERLDSAGVKEKMGVTPECVIDLLAMMGDSSDNVPGIPGVGPKTAVNLLEQFGSLDETLARADEIKAKGVRAKVSENKELALLSRELVTILTDAPIELDLESKRVTPPDEVKLRKVFTELEFTTFLKELLPASGSLSARDSGASAEDPGQVDYKVISKLPELEAFVDSMLELDEISIDTETTSLSHLDASLVGVSITTRAGEGRYLPFGHPEEKRNLPRERGLAELQRLLADEGVQKTGQNIKYDLHIFANAGLTVKNVGFDTMLAAYVLDPASRRYSLDDQVYERFNHRMQPISELIGSGKKQKSFADVPLDDAVYYACEDADFTYRLRGALEPELDWQGVRDLYFDIELPLIEVLLEMERTGVKIDSDFLGHMSDELEKEIDAVQRKIYAEVGHEINLNSPAQLSKALFEELGLPTKGKTAKKTGYSTDVRVLEELSSLHPVPQMVLEYRQLTKLKSTYVDALPALINEKTGRVHTTFNQTIAATGRLSSTDPNLQNIPIRTELGSQIRKAFVPADDDSVIMSADYSQIELRVLAHVANDKGLIKSFKNSEDIHRRTASEVFGVALEDVTAEQRRVAKTANFAVVYGVSAYGLSQQSEMDVSEAKEFIEEYFKRYPGIRKYMDTTIELARKNGFVETLTGRRRRIQDISSKNFQVRQFAERIAINTPIQGTAADIIKIAMLKAHRELAGLESKMILQVHDELTLEVKKTEEKKVRKIIKEAMEGAMKLKVPLVADIGVGPNWLAAK